MRIVHVAVKSSESWKNEEWRERPVFSTRERADGLEK